MPSPRYTPDEVATWIAGSTRLLEALSKALDGGFDIQFPSPLFKMATRQRGDGKLTATLAEIAAGLEALGPLEDLPLLPRRVIRKKPAQPSERTRRGRARPLPDVIILRRYGRAGAFWLEVLRAVDRLATTPDVATGRVDPR